MMMFGKPRWHIGGPALAISLVTLASLAADAVAAPPQNVVVFLADDLRWTDLPFLSEPEVWMRGSTNRQDQPLASPPDAPDKNSVEMGELREGAYRRPDLNRTAARLFAGRDGSLGRVRPDDPAVVPIDLDLDTPAGEDGTAEDFRYDVGNPACRDKTVAAGSNPDCPPSRDVLDGFGGLGRLATEGVVIPRFYSNSARCAPSRVAFLTGRHQQRAGVTDNGNPLYPESSVTFAELLKQGCAEGDERACYHTGFFGKWNPSGGGNKAWVQGFDEFIGFESAARPYFSSGSATCSPGLDHAGDPVRPRPARFCVGRHTDFPACTTNVDCPLSAPYQIEDQEMICSEYGRCYNPKPTKVCEEDSNCCPSGSCPGACQTVPRYIGPKNQTACEYSRGRASMECCQPRSSSSPERGQQFALRGHRAVVDGDAYPIRFEGGDACNDDGPYTSEDDLLSLPPPGGYQACVFSDRLVRDFARNFLIRRLYDDPEDRFLLVVTPKAAHESIESPDRSREHYLNVPLLKPSRPSTNSAGYWALIEELDATVGTILNLIDGMCDAGSSEQLIGSPCLPGDEEACGGQPEHCVSHRDDTLVLFTNDNGSPGNGWGQPDLRGAKQSTLEGGTRVGLVARAPGLGIGRPVGESTGRQNESTTSIGNLVDVFSTIAEAAGYDLSDDGEGHAKVSVCTGTTDLCTSNADCSPNACVPYFIDGRSLVSVLNGEAEDGSTVTPGEGTRRDFVFTNYPAAGEPSNAVTTRDGYFPTCDTDEDGEVSRDEASSCSAASHVCGYSAKVIPAIATAQVTRQHYGASCMACVPPESGQPDSCGNERCEVVGKVCLDPEMDNFEECRDLSRSGSAVLEADHCEIPRAQRCRSNDDCPKDFFCYNDVAIKCEQCTAASWKARTGADAPLPTELFDLASNPEEDPKQFNPDPQAQSFYGGDGHLNCAMHSLGSSQQIGKIQTTRAELGDRLDDWQTCVTNFSNSGVSCEVSP